MMDRFRVLSDSGGYYVYDTMWGSVIGPYLSASEAYGAIGWMREDGME